MNVSAVRWLLLLLLGLLALAAAADEYDEYEDVPAPVKPLRPSLPRQARRPVIGRPAPKTAGSPKTTTTTTEAPAEYDEEEEEAVEEPVTTTTEMPKKSGLRTGVVRPFRSNTDLIDALKRRRQQASASASTNTAPSQPTERASSVGRARESDQTGSPSSARKFSGRGKTVKTESPSTEPPEEPTPKPRLLFGRNRKF